MTEHLSLRSLPRLFVDLVRREGSALFLATLGAIFMSFSLVALTVPYRFAGAGLAGVALLARYLLDVSPAWILLAGNALLLAWGWRALSPRFVLWTLYVSLVSSAAVGFFERFSYPMLDEHLLAAILAGVCSGLGIGMVFTMGGSTGGTDVVVATAKRRWGVDMGMFSFYLNTGILLLSCFAVSMEQLLMGGVLLYVESITIDSVLKSFDRRKQMMIITDRMEEVRRYIVEDLDKSATILRGEGAYTGGEKPVILVVLNNRQAMELKRFTVSVDPGAFIILADVAEVVGEGFKHWKHI